MSGASARKRILKTSVAAAAAGAGLFAPLAPLAQEAAAPLDPVSIRIGANAEFTRIEFAGVIGARSRVRREGQDLVVRIGSTAAPDVANRATRASSSGPLETPANTRSARPSTASAPPT